MKKSTKETMKNIASVAGTIALAGLYLTVGVLAAVSDADTNMKKKNILKDEINGLENDVNKIDNDIKTMEARCGEGMSYADYEAARRLKAEKEAQMVAKKSAYNELVRKGY
jgi:hypothetical protein